MPQCAMGSMSGRHADIDRCGAPTSSRNVTRVAARLAVGRAGKTEDMSLLLLVIIGAALWSLLGAGTHRARYRSSRFGSNGMGFGRMPGDINYRGPRTRVYAPIMSSLLISLVLSIGLTILLNVVMH